MCVYACVCSLHTLTDVGNGSFNCFVVRTYVLVWEVQYSNVMVFDRIFVRYLQNIEIKYLTRVFKSFENFNNYIIDN